MFESFGNKDISYSTRLEGKIGLKAEAEWVDLHYAKSGATDYYAIDYTPFRPMHCWKSKLQKQVS